MLAGVDSGARVARRSLRASRCRARAASCGVVAVRDLAGSGELVEARDRDRRRGEGAPTAARASGCRPSSQVSIPARRSAPSTWSASRRLSIAASRWVSHERSPARACPARAQLARGRPRSRGGSGMTTHQRAATAGCSAPAAARTVWRVAAISRTRAAASVAPVRRSDRVRPRSRWLGHRRRARRRSGPDRSARGSSGLGGRG